MTATRFTEAKLPRDGFFAGDPETGPTITGLEYRAAERGPDFTKIEVRGSAQHLKAEGDRTLDFAGYVILRDGRDWPEYALKLTRHGRPVHFAEAPEQVEWELVLGINHALDECADAFMEAEMRRICGE